MRGGGEDHRGDGDREPFPADQIAEEVEPNDLEQGRAEEQQQPEGDGEADRQRQLHSGLPGGVEIGRKGRDPAPLKVRGQDEVVADEQGGGGEQGHRPRQEGRVAGGAVGVRARARHAMPGEQGQEGRGDGAPSHQNRPAHASDAGQQQHRDHDQDQTQGTEQFRDGRGPAVGVCMAPARRLIEPPQGRALEQADGEADPDQMRRSGAAEAVTAGSFGGVCHAILPDRRHVTPFPGSCLDLPA